jgi:hypothetical protein
MITTIVTVLIGAAVLLFGRRLFWLFVGAVGFIVGIELTTRFLQVQPEWLVILIGVLVGLVAAGLAVLLQRIAIGVAGFFAGAEVTSIFLTAIGVNLGGLNWILLLVGGIVAAVLVIVLFDWALVVLSALTGAALILRPFALQPWVAVLLFVVLFLVGFFAQGIPLLRREEPGEMEDVPE